MTAALLLDDGSPSSKCINCGAVVQSHAKFCLVCGVAQPSEPFAAATASDMANANLIFPKLRMRYREAYTFASGLVGTGRIVRIAGLVSGGVLLLVGIIFFFRDDGWTGAIQGILFILIGAMSVGVGFIAGTLLAAIGQFMNAGIDMAVNTSSNISPEEKAKILGLC